MPWHLALDGGLVRDDGDRDLVAGLLERGLETAADPVVGRAEQQDLHVSASLVLCRTAGRGPSTLFNRPQRDGTIPSDARGTPRRWANPLG